MAAFFVPALFQTTEPSVELQLTITRSADGAIHVRDQDGLGLVFWRGIEEVREYVQTPDSGDGWESRLKFVLAEKLKTDSRLPNVKDETFTLTEQKRTAVRR